MSMVHNHGNYIARLHDMANRDKMHLKSPVTRRCEYGKHAAPSKGGVRIGRFWCCAKCRGAFQ